MPSIHHIPGILLRAFEQLFRRTSSTNRLIKSLDGARGFAVLLVLLDHFEDRGGQLIPDFSFQPAGKLGVYLFFALSAFLLTIPFASFAPDRLQSSRTWLNYLIRRTLRIIPLYVAVLVVTAWYRPSFTGMEGLNHLLLRDGQGHLWTIPVEIKYYMILPMLVFVAAWWLRQKYWLAAIGTGALVWFIAEALPWVEERWTVGDDNVFLGKCLNVFLVGSAAAIVHTLIDKKGWSANPLLKTICEVAAIGSLAVMLLRIPSLYNAVFQPAQPVEDFARERSFAAFFWPLFLLCLVHGRGWLRAVFESRPLRFLGIISYSIYLWHPLVLKTVQELEIPAWIKFFAMLAVVTLTGFLSWWLIERPLARIRLTKPPAPGTFEPKPVLHGGTAAV